MLLQGDTTRPSIRAVRVPDGALTLDGVLAEDAWKGVPSSTGFRQREPDEGQAATDTTEVWVVYDDRTLYAGILARGDHITSRILQRDRLLVPDFLGRPQFGSDDAVAILLDGFHDHRNAVKLTYLARF